MAAGSGTWDLSDNDIAALRAVLVQRGKLIDALGMMYDKWENGIPCYDDPEDCSGSNGNAFKLSEEEEREVLSLIPQYQSKPITALPQGARVRVDHPRYHGEGIVQYDSGPRKRVIGVLLENGNVWEYEVETVTLIEPKP